MHVCQYFSQERCRVTGGHISTKSKQNLADHIKLYVFMDMSISTGAEIDLLAHRRSQMKPFLKKDWRRQRGPRLASHGSLLYVCIVALES